MFESRNNKTARIQCIALIVSIAPESLSNKFRDVVDIFFSLKLFDNDSGAIETIRTMHCIRAVLLFRLSKKKQYLCYGWFFLFSQLYLKISTTSNQIFFLQSFLQTFGSLKVANLVILWTNFKRFEGFIHTAESVMRIIYACQIIMHKKVVPN